MKGRNSMDYILPILILISHIIVSLFLGKPKYEKQITAMIWALFGVLYVILILLKLDILTICIASLILQIIFYIFSTEGKTTGKIFLLLTYTSTFFLFLYSMFFIQLNSTIKNDVLELILCGSTLLILDAYLVVFLLPKFHRSKPLITIKNCYKYYILQIVLLVIFLLLSIFSKDQMLVKTDYISFIGFILIYLTIYAYLYITINELSYQKDKLLEWQKMAYLDSLTSLNNRHSYIEYIENLSITNKDNTEVLVAIIMVDIDCFKEINDTYGHLKGDETLKQLAQSANEIFFEENYKKYRIGGDEFAIISEGKTEEEINGIIKDFITHLNQQNISISIGYSFVDFTQDKATEKAFYKADKLMYKDKNQK